MVVLKRGMKVVFIIVLLLQSIVTSAQSGIKSAISQASSAQSFIFSPPAELKVGDIVPDIEFSTVDGNRIRLSDYRGKLVILDFWATWCAACIKNFGTLNTLQKDFDGKIQILLVNSRNTGDTKSKVKAFFEKRAANGFTNELVIIVNDSIAEIYFPHRQLPHYVWIAPDGRVKAITDSKQVTVENIQVMLDNGSIALPTKKDIYLHKLLEFDDNTTINDFQYYTFLKKGKIEGYPSAFKMRLAESDGQYRVKGIAMINLPLVEMYRQGIFFNKKLRTFYNKKRILLDVKVPSNLTSDLGIDGSNAGESLYSMDLVTSVDKMDSLYQQIIDLLNAHSGYYGQIEKRRVKCLTLVRTGKMDKLKAKGDKFEIKHDIAKGTIVLRNSTMSRVVNAIENMKLMENIILIDETGFKETINIELPLNPSDIKSLQKVLSSYDLGIVESERELEMFVIKEK